MNSLSLVILTHDRPEELRRTVACAAALPERPPIIVVDNASRGDAVAQIAAAYPDVTHVRLASNIGAAGRNVGVSLAATRYVAFSDDDTEWQAGSLARAAVILDSHPRVAAVAGRVLVGAEGRIDPVSQLMAASPLPSEGLPGRAVLGFLAGCVVFRRDAFLEAGGYERRFFIGGEESLLALDLAVRGWHIVYNDALSSYHYPSPSRNRANRRRIIARNALWLAWLRRPAAAALLQTGRVVRRAFSDAPSAAGCLDAVRGLLWVARNRCVVPPDLEAQLARLDA